MAYIISSDCMDCGVCEFMCPKDAIYEAKNQFVIGKERCDDCGTCVPYCPARAISPRPRTVSVGNGPSATSCEASSDPSTVECTRDVAPPVAEALAGGDLTPAINPIAAFAKLILAQWMAAFVTYEVLAATIDKKGRYLPTLGI